MAAIVEADVVGHAAELTIAPAVAKADIIAYANVALNPDSFGGENSITLRMARILFACHLLTVELMAGGALHGPVVSETEGPFSQTYRSFTNELPSTYNSTSYGAAFWSMINRSLSRGAFVL